MEGFYWERELCRSMNHYLLASWNRVLLEKLTVSQLAKKFPALYGTRMFITAFTRSFKQSLS
jgi:hypothetical protein